ncbi:hypothetical protein PtA15_10A231 [Puccinia triticina]|uniref:LITAF domain-containing protein n=1 Tax=Puccinia triticina TaxID=208348 RepID=A0ABY7CXG5_9BASI|nr:uncharacterized protein PtA15_10A231 [Puccinia triticina]WAQ88811.1 hypothetical protein PtA15_10A231 [Puccinia triticina]
MVSLLIEDALIKDACLSAPSTSFRRSSSWPKTWARLRFRLRRQWSQPAFLEPFSLWLLALAVLVVVARETLGGPGSWAGGLAWHDLPFRARCGFPTDDPPPAQPPLIAALPGLRLLTHAAPFRRPPRALILLEAIQAALALLQPAQHFLPQWILPKLLTLPPWLTRRRRNALRRRTPADPPPRPDHPLRLFPPADPPPPPVEVETKWLLGVLVEASIGTSAILGYIIVMVHIPYASHYSIPFFLAVYAIKATCSICFEDAAGADDLPPADWLHYQTFCPVCHRDVL